MENRYPHVLSPIRVRGHLIRNRIITGPTTLHSASNGEPYPIEEAMRFFEDRARLGAGIVTVTGVGTGPAFDDGKHAAWDLYTDNRTNSLAQLVERIHFHGAKASMELMGIFPDGYTVSDGCPIMGGPGGREIPREVMAQFKDWYVFAARKLKALGYDGLLFHFGHSVPIAQFLSPLTNRRADEYGGSTGNRCRYPVEVLREVRAAVGGDMFIEVRISGNEFREGGIDTAEGIRIAEILQDHCDILQVSAGMHDAGGMTRVHPCGFLPPMPNVHLAGEFRKSGRIRVPLTAIGAIPDLAAAEEIVASGTADFVLFARALIADPDMIRKCRAGRPEDVRPCIKCMRCHDSTVYGNHFICAVNPEVGLEHLDHLATPPARTKRVAVVGGGPAGMQAALTACDRGHAVTLFEKEPVLGGKLVFARHVPFKYPLDAYMNWLVGQVNKRGIDVRLGTEARPEDVRDYDAVIAAVGAEPVIPRIPGVENAVPATAVYGNEGRLGDTVAVIGGGQVGCETALHLAGLGRDVTIIEMLPALAPDASATHRDELLLELDRASERLHVVTGARCTGIGPDGITYEKDGREVGLGAQSVVLSAGMRALCALADGFMGLTAEYAEAGDCVRARTVEQAAKEGYYAAVVL